MSEGLAKLLAGNQGHVTYPRVPRTLPARDMFGPRPVKRASMRKVLGEKYFERKQEESAEGPMYTIGQLGKLLGRAPVSIRAWERTGVIPKPDHYTQGDERNRKRLYTHKQAMMMLSVAGQEGVLGSKNADLTNFKARVWELW